jgi:hypothetical protein
VPVPFHRGAVLATSDTFGFSELADLGPTAGNGFETSWPDDLRRLADVGISDVRITLDWARLQTRTGGLAPDWVENYRQLLSAATEAGLRPWATLHDGSVPRWFDDEGGLADEEAFVRRWPRWVEQAADRFGDAIHGWVPFARIPAGAPVQPWRDTWGILAGGPAVVASVDTSDGLDTIERYVGRCDRLGLIVTTPWDPAAAVGDRDLDDAANRWGDAVRDGAARVDRTPIVLAGFTAGHDDPGTAGRITEVFVDAMEQALGDGIEIDICFLDPALAGPGSPVGLLDADRSPTPVAVAFAPAT